MANEQNLKPQSKRTKSEQRRIATMGGKASGEVRRKRKTFKETLDMLMAMPLNDADIDEIDAVVSFMALQGKNIDVGTAICIKQAQRALKGDPRAFELIRDTAGERPKLEAQTNTQALEKLDDVLAKIGGVVGDIKKE